MKYNPDTKSIILESEDDHILMAGLFGMIDYRVVVAALPNSTLEERQTVYTDTFHIYNELDNTHKDNLEYSWIRIEKEPT